MALTRGCSLVPQRREAEAKRLLATAEPKRDCATACCSAMLRCRISASC